MTTIERAIVRTVQYFNLFDQPVTAVQIWQFLIMVPAGQAVGVQSYTYSLRDIQQALISSPVIHDALEQQWGYVFVQGRHGLVEERLVRHRRAQLKWKLTRRIVRWLQYVPFVRMIAMSGSLAMGNTKPSSDLDLFVVTRAGRIWLTRLGLLLVTQLLGRRRRYWDQQAPDQVCLNHYITDQSLTIVPVVRNVYAAILFRALRPLTGWSVYGDFMLANREWTEQYLAAMEQPRLPYRQMVPTSRLLSAGQRIIERVVGEPLFDVLEGAAEKIQRYIIVRHTVPDPQGRVAVSAAELAFHPNTKVPGLLARIERFS